MSNLIRDSFHCDPRIIEAKRLILEALKDAQEHINNVETSKEKLRESYASMIQRFGVLRGNPLYFQYLGSGFGKGALVELADGSVKYDFITGIGVHAWGHCHPELLAVQIDAALEDTVMQGNLQQTAKVVEFTEKIVKAANQFGASLDHCFLTSSGAMANENALKLIFHKKYPASRILCFENCFAGRTLALAQVTDKASYRTGIPPTLTVDYLPFFDRENAVESTQRSLAMLKKYLARYPNQHACMFFELIQGEGGYYPGNRDFFLALMEVLKDHEIPIVIDEVQTFGRTSQLFSFQHFGLDAYVQVVTFGKMSQVCGTLFSREFKPKPGLVSQTFTSSTSAIYAGTYILDSLLQNNQFGSEGKNVKIFNYFTGKLRAIANRNPNTINGPFGVGAMIGFTFLDGAVDKTKAFVQALFDAGVIGFIAGSSPVRVRFLVPTAVVTEQDIDHVAEIIESTLHAFKADDR